MAQNTEIRPKNLGISVTRISFDYLLIFLMLPMLIFFFDKSIFFKNIGPGAFLFLVCFLFSCSLEYDETSIDVHAVSCFFLYASAAVVFPIIAAVF